MGKKGFILGLLLLLPLCLRAQGGEDNTFGGWEFIEVNHDFGESPFFGSFYFEHDNYQYQLQEPSFHTHKLNLDLTGTLKSGNLKVSIRERYVHSWTPALGTESNLLRSRLKVQYAIPESRWSPYLAVEVFTWGDTWKKTRHYVACNYDFSDKVQLEAYYLYYAFNGVPAEHVIGLGLNFFL